MATIQEIRNSEQARAWLLAGLSLARAAPKDGAAQRQALRVALELVGSGSPLLPLGMVADVVHLMTASLDESSSAQRTRGASHLAGIIEQYEYYVVGKCLADASFDRAAAAIARYQGREQDKALAFVIDQLRERAGLDGVLVSPAVVRGLLQASESSVSSAMAEQEGLSAAQHDLEQMYRSLIARVRDVGDLLGKEDLFELEHRTAIAPAGERLALRQTLTARELLLEGVSNRPPRSAARHREVPTRLLDENAYPVGGFTSISTRGTIESLLHSQLAFMERDPQARPDLFDIKFLRDELLYYSRDENQFFRRRRTILFVLYPELRATRLKDAGMPFQRIVLVLGLVLAAIDRLRQWLGEESLRFDVLLLEDNARSLAAEHALLQLVLREAIAGGTATVEWLPRSRLAEHCAEAARTSLCQAVALLCKPREVNIRQATWAQARLDAPLPALVEGDEVWKSEAAGITAWQETLARLLELLR